MVLQMLRNVVARGDAGVYFSFEHDAPTLLERFIALEAAEIAGVEALSLRRIREAMEGLVGIGGLAERLSGAIGGAEAVHVVAGLWPAAAPASVEQRVHVGRDHLRGDGTRFVGRSVGRRLWSSTTCRRWRPRSTWPRRRPGSLAWSKV